MNKRIHRLVFNRNRGMRVPAGEHVRSAGKPGCGRTRAVAVAAALAVAGLVVPAQEAQAERPRVRQASALPKPRFNLPQPYGTRHGVNPNPGSSAYRQVEGGSWQRADFVADRPFVRVTSTSRNNPDGHVWYTVDGTTATFNQGVAERIIANWDSFDIGPGYRVTVLQDPDPSKYVSALFKVWSIDSAPSMILGSLDANREVIIQNANGFFFGRNARVNTAKFVASTLSIADATFDKGIRNILDGTPAFSAEGTDYLPANLDAYIAIERGAEIVSAAQGDVMIIAPRVSNQGRILTPGGQALLAAGSKVYLVASDEPSQRGLIVAVDPFKLADGTPDPELGIVEQMQAGEYKTVDGATVDDDTPDTTAGLVKKINEIVAEQGTINLVGLTVRQNGVLRATTAVKGENGSIYLQAQSSVKRFGATAEMTALRSPLSVVSGEDAQNYAISLNGDVEAAVLGDRLGTVEVGANSLTEVLPSQSGQGQLDSEVFTPSLIQIEGSDVTLRSGAQVIAPSGKVNIFVSDRVFGDTLVEDGYLGFARPTRSMFSRVFNRSTGVQSGGSRQDTSRLLIEAGARLDVAGLRDVAVDGARNQAELRLFRIELADAPVQRGGVLYRSPVSFDLRDAKKIGIANVQGVVANVQRTAAERSTVGGALRIESAGAALVEDGVQIDISGGSVAYTEASIKSTRLARGNQSDSLVDADKGLVYDALQQPARGRVVPAYVEGRDGGSLRFLATRGAFHADLKADEVQGPYQRRDAQARAKRSSATFGYADRIRLLATQLPAPQDMAALTSTLDIGLDSLQRSGVGQLNLRAGSVEQPEFFSLDLGAGGGLNVQAQRVQLDGAFRAPGGTVQIKTSLPDGNTLAVAAGNPADPSDDRGDIDLSPRTQLSVAGQWTNDRLPAGASLGDVLQLDGGRITLEAVRSLLLDGATLDVSAGAWLPATGSAQLGQAGSLILGAGIGLAQSAGGIQSALSGALTAPWQLRLGEAGGPPARLLGYDFAEGGTLELTAPQITFSADGSRLGSYALGLALAPAFLEAGGFGDITLASWGDLTVTSGSTLAPVLHNWVLDPRAAAQPSGALAASLVDVQVRDEAVADRAPVNLTLQGKLAFDRRGTDTASDGASVVVERGSRIQLEPRARLTLQATRNIWVGVSGAADADPKTPDTVIEAPAGTLTLQTTGIRGGQSNENSEDLSGFDPTQAIWIGQDTRLSVAGTGRELSAAQVAALRNRPRGLRSLPGAWAEVAGALFAEAVWGGGQINLDAARGYVMAEAGSVLDLSGFAANAFLPGVARPVYLAADAGTLTVSTPEGGVVESRIVATVPQYQGQPAANGAGLDLTVGEGGVERFARRSEFDYPADPRQLVVGEAPLSIQGAGLAAGDDIRAAYGNGSLWAGSGLLAAFDSLHLGAGDRIVFAGAPSAPAAGAQPRIAIEARRALELEAPVLQVQGWADVSLAATRVWLGRHQLLGVNAGNPDASAAPSAHQQNTLRVQASVIEVADKLGLQGIDATTFTTGADRSGELRFLGQARLGVIRPVGELNFAGTLELIAGQVYAGSYADFVIQGPRITVQQPAGGSTSRPPLSVFGSLSLAADQIEQLGVIRQPFGTISLVATDTLTLGANSLTSVSGAGLNPIFGTTANLTQWNATSQLSDQLALPEDKRIELKAPTLVNEATAVVSAEGGGDVHATEFFPGVGGSTDYFETPGLYAVLPSYDAAAAPAGAGGEAGRQLVITVPGSALPPGRYTLLPARYALMPGSNAVLVRALPSGGVLGGALKQADGSTIVSGYFTEAGATAPGQPGQRVLVEPAATYRAKSDVRVTALSDFLAAQAAADGRPTPPLPRDGGQVQVVVTGKEGGNLQAQLRLGAGTGGGRAGLLDVSATRIAVVQSLGTTPTGDLGLLASSLAESGAGSVLLGGLRTQKTETVTVLGADQELPLAEYDVSASTVTRAVTVLPGVAIAPDATTGLGLEELILAAADSVSIGSATGAPVTIQTTAAGTAGERVLNVAGNGALAVVSANTGLDVRRDLSDAKPADAGNLSLGQGVKLAGQAVQLDATGSVGLNDSARVQASAEFGLGAQRLVVGETTGQTGLDGATRLSGTLLDSVLAAPALNLRAYEGIDFIGRQNWDGFQRLVLDTPALNGRSQLDADGSVVARAEVDLAAREVLLRNTTGNLADAAAAADGSTLRIQALPLVQYGRTGGITIGPGEQRAGFASVELTTSGDLILDGTGGLRTPGNLTVTSARVTATSGADSALRAAGDLAFKLARDARTVNERVGLGARLAVEGRTIQQGGIIELPSGVLSFQATGVAGSSEAAIQFLNTDPATGRELKTSVAGVAIPAQDGWTVYGDAGSIQATAVNGFIEVQGLLDASAALGPDGQRHGDAGGLSFSATGEDGQLKLGDDARLLTLGGREAGDQGGRFLLDVRTLADANALADALSAGGATREIDWRVRTDDLNLARDLRAQRIVLAADAGSLTLTDVVLNAQAEAGGVVQLWAGRDLTLAGRTEVQAQSSRAGANGGDVLLAAAGTDATGRLSVGADTVVNAGGDDAQDGRIVLRSRRTAANGVNLAPLNTANLQAGEVAIEAVKVYDTVNGTPIASIGSGSSAGSKLGQSAVKTDNDALLAAANVNTVLGALGVAAEERDRVSLRAGVEVRAAGDLTVANDWLLSGGTNAATGNAGDTGGFLTLRAQGDLLVNNTLSSGFTTAVATGAVSNDTRGWSYRLVAGADPDAAQALATRDLSGAADTRGVLSIAANKMVRTTAGSIELAAGRDLVFRDGGGSGAPGLAYVAGRKLASPPDTTLVARATQNLLTERGGRLEASARRNVSAPDANQFIGNWFTRAGRLNSDGTAFQAATAWWSDFSVFRQTLGSFGGGNVRVSAGGDIDRLSVVAPTSAWADTLDPQTAQMVVNNGGDVDVRAGGDVRGGQFLLGRGQGTLTAEGAIRSSETDSLPLTTLALMDGQWSLNARSDLSLGEVFNPTVTVAGGASASYFFTYGADAALKLMSTGGGITLGGNTLRFSSLNSGRNLISQLSDVASTYTVMPSVLQAYALGGDFRLAGVKRVLFPDAEADLQLYAAGDLRLTNEAALAIADGSPETWNGVGAPIFIVGTSPVGEANVQWRSLTNTQTSNPGTILQPYSDQDPGLHSALHAASDQPVRIAAGGDLSFAGNTALLNLPKPAVITAGGNIENLTLYGQHHRADDQTTIRAGGDFVLTRAGAGVALAGPGQLTVEAGGDVDLGDGLSDATGFTGGLETVGNEKNPSLPAQGASIKLVAGARGTLNAAAFRAGYLDDGSQAAAATYRQALVDYVAAALNQAPADFESAWTAFLAFPQEAQGTFARQVQQQAFLATYAEAAAPGAAAIEAALRVDFERQRLALLSAAQSALAAGQAFTLSGESLQGADLAKFVTDMDELAFDDLKAQRRVGSLQTEDLIAPVVAQREAALGRYAGWWQQAQQDLAASLGRTVAEIEALARTQPQDERVQRYQTALKGEVFERYRDAVLASEVASAGDAAAEFGRQFQPLRQALFAQGFQAGELAGVGSFQPQAHWPGLASAFDVDATMNLTGNKVQTNRGGDIWLQNPGGDINVGLKDNSGSSNGARRGVLALRNGNIYAYLDGDLQVNTERVFVVGQGDVRLWSSNADIDSGRGSNLAVGAPPLQARRGADGVVFERPPQTSGSGLGVLPDAAGLSDGTIGLYTPNGQILALDAFIRAPEINIAGPVIGTDNLLSPTLSGASVAVAAPAINVSAPTAAPTSAGLDEAVAKTEDQAGKRNSVLTVELLGMGDEAGTAPAPAPAAAEPAAPTAPTEGEEKKDKKAAPGT